MKPSPIQTKSLIYGELHVSPYDNGQSEFEDDFTWHGVNIQINTRHAPVADSENEYALLLRLRVPNKDGKPAPYSLDLSVMGKFSYIGAPRDDALDLVVVNGLSILYSSLRETVMTVTSRMLYGPLCLPGANFADHAPSLAVDQSPPSSGTGDRNGSSTGD